jgi:hypothetical protein
MTLSAPFAHSLSYLSLSPLFPPSIILDDSHLSHLAAATLATLSTSVDWWNPNWQVSSVTRILNSPSEKYSAMEHLTLEHWNNMRSVEVYMKIEYV